jgi:hypothetical protein
MLSICKAYDNEIYEKFDQVDGFFINDRMYNESIRRSKFTESRRNNAKSVKNDSISIASAKHMHTHMETETETINENKTINKTKAKIHDWQFEQWWNDYDKKVSKEKAIAKWNILTSDEKQLALKIVQEYVNSTPDKTFRKDPTTYLNNKSFNDEIIIRSSTTSHKPNVSERNFTQLASLKYIEPKRD